MSPEPEAFVISGASRHRLTEEPILVPAGTVILEVAAVPGPDAVRLNGQRLAVAYDAGTSRATAALDLNRYTGYHLLQVAPARRYFFGTEDAKLRIEGVVEMLQYLREQGLAWRGSLYFSETNQTLRDSRLDRAWLDLHGPEILLTGREIAAAPAVRVAYHSVRARHGVPDIGRTMKLLRRRTELLERHPAGPILVNEETWAPQAIIARERIRQHDCIPNRRATALLVYVVALVDAVLAAAPPKTDLESLTELRAESQTLLLVEPFRTLLRLRLYEDFPELPRDEETYDARYMRSYALLRDLLEERRWDPTSAITPEYAYATYADQVYQAFAATILANALGLGPAAGGLQGGGPHFLSDRLSMWINAKPPANVVSDWRDGTARKSALRPDMTLLETATGRVALLDAKYRRDGDAATPESLTEAQLYLQAYQRKKVGVVFPPETPAAPWPIARHRNAGFSLFEIPLRPSPGLAAYAASDAASAVEELLH